MGFGIASSRFLLLEDAPLFLALRLLPEWAVFGIFVSVYIAIGAIKPSSFSYSLLADVAADLPLFWIFSPVSQLLCYEPSLTFLRIC